MTNLPTTRQIRSLGPLQRDVLDTLRSLRLASAQEVADEVGRRYLPVFKSLRACLRQGLAARTGHKTNGIGRGTTPYYWHLTPLGFSELALREAIGRPPGMPVDWAATTHRRATDLSKPWIGGLASPKQMQVLRFLAAAPRTRAQLSELTHTGVGSMRSRLKYLRQHGLAICESRSWSITDQGLSFFLERT